jgi:hypothetical protein
MKPRHAAALALVGWYLMLPPFNGKSVDADAPLSKWTVYATSDSVGKREGTRMIAAFKRSQADANMQKELEAAQCVASDDARLAK